ncbi:transcriptional regulator [Dyella lipolytica]|uniref:Transcriptional regulator n=1 Tax=Dyella lipolytica TaxID=1867835 RepID=A0ABW8ISY7_9GAMM|nr:YciI family protein [Dyella lipolytica]GLQ46676.1 transcriptional regulator [Dyella lipolytica]
MQFLSIIRINESSTQQPDQRLMNDMGKLMEEMTKAGILVDTAGLKPSVEGARVKLSRGKISRIDGPFAEAKEVIGGYAILEAPSMDEAVHASRRFLEVHGDGWDIDCEIREMVRHPDASAT